MIPRLMITPAQCRAGRSLIKWSQNDLAKVSQVGVATIRVFETEKAKTRPAIINALQRALEDAGVIFVAQNGYGAGARLRDKV